MKHIDEETLELYILESDDVADRRAEIASHLKECAACAALLKEIEEYYTQVQDIHQERARATSQALTVRSMAVKVPTYTEFGPLSQIRKTWPAQAMLFVIRHPVVSSTGFLTVFAAAVLAISTLVTIKDKNVSYARARDGFLVAYNKEGDVLWRKEVDVAYDMENLKGKYDLSDYLATIDVDGDGTPEVIAIFTGISDSPSTARLRSTIYCYNSDGKERWHYEIHRDMTFGTEKFPDDYHFYYMAVGDFDHNGSVEVVAVAAHSPNYPSLVLHFNANTGELLHEYWHSGVLGRVFHKDIDGDGVEELLIPGQNNGFNLACLLVLDPRSMSGHAPAPPAYTPVDVGTGTEKYYLLFPRNDMKAVADQKRNVVQHVKFNNDGSIVVFVAEAVVGYKSVLYHLAPSLACTGVEGEDFFVALHHKLEAEGKLTRKLDDKYWEELRQGVQYWDGEHLVNTPTANKRYTNLP
jgi:hypothetical protein